MSLGRLSTKFLLMALSVAVVIGLLTAFIVQGFRADVGRLELERAGLRGIAAVDDVAARVSRIQVLGALPSAGAGGRPERLEKIRSELQRALDQFAGQMKQDATVLRVGEAARAIHADIDRFAKSDLHEPGTASQSTGQALLGRLRDLRVMMGDNAGLLLDPQLEAHYMILALLNESPRLVSAIGSLAGMAVREAAAGPGEASDAQASQMEVDSTRSALSAIVRALEKAAKIDEALAGAVAEIRDHLSPVERLLGASPSRIGGSSPSAAAESALIALDAVRNVDRLVQRELNRVLDRRALVSRSAGHSLALGALVCISVWLALLGGLYVYLRDSLDALKRRLEAIGEGDLAVALEPKTQDEIGALFKQAALARDSLAGLVRQISATADAISAAAGQIGNSNRSLSYWTDSSAASIEQTAQAMEELTSTVQSNADNASAADGLAASSMNAAGTAGEMVSQVVGTMNGISASSKKVVDIIGVINGIAFQTNILALNAAVEAARAGEQGRGFAVVAAEVRGLAQRSSAAAREIKLLIETSVQEIRAGGSVVNRAGTAMREVVASVSTVSAMIAEISNSSAEQARGIASANEAIVRLQQMTQEKSTMVGESAAAAVVLDEQAKRMGSLVNRFRLPGDAASGINLHHA